MADLALAASALLMGLAGGPHCAAMCGPLQAGLSARGGARALAAMQAGRVVGYAAAGALVAASVSTLAAWAVAAPLLRPLWGVLHVAAIALGLWLLWQGRAPAWLARVGSASPALSGAADAPGAPQPLRFVRRMPAAMGAATAGVCWAAMPCGLLQSALLVAALGSGPAGGAAIMAAFAIASAASLALAPWLWTRLAGARAKRPARTALAVRCAGVLLAGSSYVALGRGLAALTGGAICLTPF